MLPSIVTQYKNQCNECLFKQMENEEWLCCSFKQFSWNIAIRSGLLLNCFLQIRTFIAKLWSQEKYDEIWGILPGLVSQTTCMSWSPKRSAGVALGDELCTGNNACICSLQYSNSSQMSISVFRFQVQLQSLHSTKDDWNSWQKGTSSSREHTAL